MLLWFLHVTLEADFSLSDFYMLGKNFHIRRMGLGDIVDDVQLEGVVKSVVPAFYVRPPPRGVHSEEPVAKNIGLCLQLFESLHFRNLHGWKIVVRGVIAVVNVGRVDTDEGASLNVADSRVVWDGVSLGIGEWRKREGLATVTVLFPTCTIQYSL